MISGLPEISRLVSEASTGWLAAFMVSFGILFSVELVKR
jgi:hypothetical protein